MRRVAKCRVGLVARLALDSICQNLSMHVTCTALLIGGLAGKLAISNDTIRKHFRSVRVVQSTSVATPESHYAPTTSLPCVLVEKPPNKHWFAPVIEDMELPSYSERIEYAPCTPVARQKTLWFEALAADVKSHRAPA